MKRLLVAIVCFALCVAMAVVCVEAHSGRTDKNGGHYDHSTGKYHYHHGYSAHQHYDMDGDGDKDCPEIVREQQERQREAQRKKEKQERNKKILIIIALIICAGIVYTIFSLRSAPRKK